MELGFLLSEFLDFEHSRNLEVFEFLDFEHFGFGP